MAKSILFLVNFILVLELSANHILGGEIYYTNLSADSISNSNTYKIDLNIYQICADEQFLQDRIDLVIYQGNLDPANNFQIITVNLDSFNIVEAPSYECIDVPFLCILKNYYSIEVDLPIIESSYHIVYQNCCRNSEINNIYDPNLTGSTFYIEINSVSQNLSNSSPKFLDFPTTVLCSNQTFSFEQAANDIDGDLLIYKFCQPLKGKGNDPPSHCSSTIFPGCPPPYESVNFIFPDFSFSEPLGQTSAININPENGIINTQPGQIGQFSISICVEEYRNGELLSLVRRDMQLNVDNCENQVLANIEANDIYEDDIFKINICQDSVVRVNNLSTQLQYIEDQIWIIENENTIDTFYDWNLITSFQNGGIYDGKLILNNGGFCSDTANIKFNINKNLNAEFSYTYDTCVAGPVIFYNSSTSEGGEIELINWDFGDNVKNTEMNPSHIYNSPNDYLVKLQVENTFGCIDSMEKSINWFPAPKTIVVAPSKQDGCIPLEVSFNNLSTPIDSTYITEWNFGDQKISSDINPRHLYRDTGFFSISLNITSPLGCKVDSTFSDWIYISPHPIADFSFTPSYLSALNSDITLIDNTKNSLYREWYINDQNYLLNAQEQIYTFPDTGKQLVTLVAINKYGCEDTISKTIDFIPINTFFLPNAFTPNGDGLNDLFIGKGLIEGIKKFSLTVWNRYGQKVFVSDDPNIGWNGLLNNRGMKMQSGVYVYTLEYYSSRNSPYSKKGFVTLIH